jgi:hypothetical protein
MKNLYEPATADEVRQRITRLRSDSARQWGKMSPAQAVAHCSVAMEWAVGDIRPPRMFLNLWADGEIEGSRGREAHGQECTDGEESSGGG